MGKIISLFFLFYSCTLISDKEYSDTLQTVEKEYHSNGELKYEANYFMGQLHGQLRSWSDTGNLISIVEYNKGRLHGSWLEYYPSGELMHSIKYINGYKDGEELWYHLNGQIQSRSYYVKGDMIGPVKRWDGDGKEIAN